MSRVTSLEAKRIASRLKWQCGDCLESVKTGDRTVHARFKHRKQAREIVWLCLENVLVIACPQCLLPHYNEINHLCTPEVKRERMRLEFEKADGVYWVDWSAGNPIIRIFDESAPEGTEWLTLLEAKEEIMYVARIAIEQWHKIVRSTINITPQEIEHH